MPPCTWPSTIIGLITLPDVVDRDVALERHLARLGVDLDHGDVRAERERAVRRVVVGGVVEERLLALRQVVGDAPPAPAISWIVFAACRARP